MSETYYGKRVGVSALLDELGEEKFRKITFAYLRDCSINGTGVVLCSVQGGAPAASNLGRYIVEFPPGTYRKAVRSSGGIIFTGDDAL